MRPSLAAIVLLAATTLQPFVLPSIAAAAPPKLTGSWEAARSPDDERVYVMLKDLGKAEIVAEYDFTLPGQPGKRRGRSTTFGQWTVKGSEVVITYAKVQDRFRYVEGEPLSVVGLSGTAPALKPIGTPNTKSKLGAVVLWKAPHEYKAQRPPGAPPASSAASGTPGASAEPAK